MTFAIFVECLLFLAFVCDVLQTLHVKNEIFVVNNFEVGPNLKLVIIRFCPEFMRVVKSYCNAHTRSQRL